MWRKHAPKHLTRQTRENVPRYASARRRSPVPRYALCALALAVLSLPLAVLTAAPADALLKIKCDPVTYAAVDPIKDHNQPNATVHEHAFFGSNNGWVAMAANRANYPDLTAPSSTSCGEKGDTAGYWAPTLYYVSGPQAGQRIGIQAFTAYYRPWDGIGSTTGAGMAHPPDTRLVSEAGQYNWTCGEKSGSRAAPQSSIPDCSGLSGRPGLTLTAHIDFPTCWDGVAPRHQTGDVGDTSDNVHYRYVVGSGSRAACPAGFPNQITALRMTIQFLYTGTGNDVALSSDIMTGNTDGRSLHGDFWNTWDQAAFNRLVSSCVNSAGSVSVCG